MNEVAIPSLCTKLPDFAISAFVNLNQYSLEFLFELMAINFDQHSFEDKKSGGIFV